MKEGTDMLAAERQQKIVELVNQKRSIRVAEISKLFSVTEETIRRDLEKLEKENKLARSHGGAISIESSPETPFSERQLTNVEEKKAIALAAVKHVNEGDKIILDASTTAWYMARAIPDMPITVLTNSIKVAMELSAKKKITVISTGGVMLPKSLSYVGPLAESSLENYHVNKAFLSCTGVHFERGISESDEEQARIKKKMIQCSDSLYLMVDHSKLEVKSFSKIGELEVIDYIISDANVKKGIVETLEDKGINVCLVSDGKGAV